MLPLSRRLVTEQSMEKPTGVELQMETLGGGLKELVMRWFTETQTQLIQVNGNFPDWFQGFATRRETEDLLRDKALGCFLIRLSDKAIGYILSYRGHDRCRHFVITQNQDGHFTISGDSRSYHSLTELIEHYKASPIQPFGEYLTSSTSEEDASELYDVINFNNKEPPGVSVQALRTLWDQKADRHREPANNPSVQSKRDSPPPVPTPSLPPETQTKTKTLMGTVSADIPPLSQSAPPIAKRGFPPGFLQTGSLPETITAGTEMESQTVFSSSERSHLDEGNNHPPLMSDSRSKSLTHLDNNVREAVYSNRSPSLAKRVTCHTYSLHQPMAQGPGPGSEQHRHDLETLKSNPLYQTSEGLVQSSGQQADIMYAEVPQSSTPAAPCDDTYEPISGQPSSPVQGNMYESLDDMKSKKSKSTWGKSNIKWKKFFPDYMKK